MSNPLKDVWDKIDEYFSSDDQLKLKTLQTSYDSLLSKFADVCIELDEANDKVRKLTPITVLCPTWLDTSTYSYVARQVIPSTKESVPIDPRGLMVRTPTLTNLVKDKKWEEMGEDEAVRQIWDFCRIKIKYITESLDHWQSPDLTLSRLAGDCDDSSLLFVALCRYILPADSVFLVTGEIKGTKGDIIEHAFPILKSGSWYVYDTTNAFPSLSPRKLANSGYKCITATNDVFKGDIRETLDFP